MAPLTVAWLRDGIAGALGWEVELADNVAHAIADEESAEEVDNLVRDFCGSNVDVVGLVRHFRDSQSRSTNLAPARQRSPAASLPTAAQTAVRRGANPRGFAVTTQRGAAVPRGAFNPGAQAAGANVVDGLTVKRNNRKNASGATKVEPPDVRLALERSICNCLGCGKIYDCRGTLSSDATAFVASGGLCTFCGLRVALNSRDRSEVRTSQPSSSAAAASAPAKEAPEANVGANDVEDSGERAAIDFKNRLVAADRDGAKRTAVLDDQADFFEIDSNAWLSEEEKRSMRARQQALPSTEEQHKKRFTISFDMLGRQVILPEEPEDMDEAEAGGCAPDSLTATSAAAAAADAAAAATAEEKPQGGGTAAQAAASAAASLRIPRNPGLRVQPMFVRPTPKPESSGVAGKGYSSNTLSNHRSDDQHAKSSANTSGKDKSLSQLNSSSRQRCKGHSQVPRIQHDDPTAAAIAPEI